MNKIKKIAVFTSIRSEYGLLSPLLKKIKEDPDFILHLLVGGAHLLDEYGMTINFIKDDGFSIHKTFPFLLTDNKPDVNTRSLGELQKQIGNYFAYETPDLLIVLGDRFELISVVSSALIYNVPIAHLSGGEVTEGAIDNQIRHAVTKMSHLHFPATETYKQNLLKMGEEEWRVCMAGETGIDEILSIDFIPKLELFEDLKLNVDQPVICCTFHPQTIDNKISPEFIKELLMEIDSNSKFQILVTASNFDSGGKEINLALEKLVEKNKKIIYIKSLGQKRYYSLLKYADMVLGNSSSGIVEAQSFNIPVVNVGNRQQGRLFNPNVFQCEINIPAILSAIEYVQKENFKTLYWNKANIYGDGDSCNKIIKFLKNLPTTNLLAKKSTY